MVHTTGAWRGLVQLSFPLFWRHYRCHCWCCKYLVLLLMCSKLLLLCYGLKAAVVTAADCAVGCTWQS